MNGSAGAPMVSICVPTYNSEDSIAETLRSALEQTYADFEVLVVDDGSSDGTVEVARQTGDERVRVIANANNVGQARNTDRCLELARGRLVKFLHSDDLLLPDCLERMVPIFEAHPDVGLVFGRRRVEGGSERWRELYSELHLGFDDLQEVSPGSDLLLQWIDAGLPGNWIGEPSSVMVRRACFERVGGFNARMVQDVDMDVWIRVLAFYDAGFVDAPVSVYRRRADSVSLVNWTGGHAWLDRLWLLEGLRDHEEVWRRYPALREMRRERQTTVFKLTARSLGSASHRRARLTGLASYLAYLAGSAAGRAPALHGPIGPPPTA
jgi:glycosyltransferase involved in cell wall biosynthesis